MAAIDVDAVVTEVVSQVVPVTLIGGAVLLLWVAIKAFKWIRYTLSDESVEDWWNEREQREYDATIEAGRDTL